MMLGYSAQVAKLWHWRAFQTKIIDIGKLDAEFGVTLSPPDCARYASRDSAGAADAGCLRFIGKVIPLGQIRTIRRDSR